LFHPNETATYVLSENEKSEIKRIIRSKIPLYRSRNYETFVHGCQEAVKELPSSIYRWRDQIKTLDLGLIRNLPIDAPLPATPTAKYIMDDTPMLADGVIGIISALFGTIYTIEGKGNERHIQNMYPVIYDEYTQLGSSSKVELEWHVEEAFHPDRPTWLSLLCLRGDLEATTKIARVKDLQLHPSVTSILREFRFQLRIDETYGIKKPPTNITTSVLSGLITDPEVVLDPAYTIFQHDIESAAVAALISAAEHKHHRFTLMKGDYLVFNNRRMIHSRSAFRPRMDGTDRWLKRAFILEASKYDSKFRNGVIPFEND
jgi:L-asparagine oxygenase